MRRLNRAIITLLVAMSLLAPATSTNAADSYEGKWRGKTGQSKRVIVRVNSDNEVTRFLAEFVAYGTGYCHQGFDYTVRAKGLSVPIKGDAFDFKVEKGPITAKISGDFSKSAEKLAGSLKASVYSVESGVIICSAKENISWKAHKV